MSDILLGAGNVPQQTFLQFNDPQGNKLVALQRDGSVFAQAINFADGTSQNTAGGGGVGGILHCYVVIPAARVLTLGSNPLTIIPGVAGKTILPVSMQYFQFQNGTTPYTVGNADLWNLVYDQGQPNVGQNAEFQSFNTAGWADQVPPSVYVSALVAPAGPGTPSGVDLRGLGILAATVSTAGSYDGVDMTDGDSDLLIDFYYNVAG